MRWTQGQLYNFQEGNTLYDTKEAYKGTWKEALKHITFGVQIKFASPCHYVVINDSNPKKQYLDQGIVLFRIYRPNREKTALEERELIECTQDNFVVFLKTGIITTKANELLDLFNP